MRWVRSQQISTCLKRCSRAPCANFLQFCTFVVAYNEALRSAAQPAPQLERAGGGCEENKTDHQGCDDQSARINRWAERWAGLAIVSGLATVRGRAVRSGCMSWSTCRRRQRHQRCCGCGAAIILGRFFTSRWGQCGSPIWQARPQGNSLLSAMPLLLTHCCGCGGCCCCSASAASRRATRCSRLEAAPWLPCTCSWKRQQSRGMPYSTLFMQDQWLFSRHSHRAWGS